MPSSGDIVFFNWSGDRSGGADHVGIVEYVEGEVVHTIEGNSSDAVMRQEYRIDSSVISNLRINNTNKKQDNALEKYRIATFLVAVT